MRYAISAAVVALLTVSMVPAPAHASPALEAPLQVIHQTRHAPIHQAPSPQHRAKPVPSPKPKVVAYRSPNTYPWGQCTWGAAQLAHDNVNRLGNARDWLRNAIARGLPTGSRPQVGATVVFQPGVQGAGSLGHVAHVIAVYADGSFQVKEMNFYGYGGGFGLWSTRVARTGWGVGFIY